MIKRYDHDLSEYDCPIRQDDNGNFYLCSDIDPILKAARVVAEVLLQSHQVYCKHYPTAKFIIEKTEGLE